MAYCAAKSSCRSNTPSACLIHAAGQLDYNGSLCKFVTGAVRNRNIYAAKKATRFGPKVCFDSKSDDIIGGLVLKKHTPVGTANWDIWLKVAGSAEVNTRTQKVGSCGGMVLVLMPEPAGKSTRGGRHACVHSRPVPR